MNQDPALLREGEIVERVLGKPRVGILDAKVIQTPGPRLQPEARAAIATIAAKRTLAMRSPDPLFPTAIMPLQRLDYNSSFKEL